MITIHNPALNVSVSAPGIEAVIGASLLAAELKSSKIDVAISPKAAGMSALCPVVKEYVDVQTYTGTTTVTPGPEAQVLPTQNYRLAEDIVINPIPNNYGLITWNGSTLTVS